VSVQSLSKRLAECPAFMALSWPAKMIFMVFWRGGQERSWDPVDDDDAVETMRAEAQGKGYCVGRDAGALDAALVEFHHRKLVRRDGPRLVMPLISSDRARGQLSMRPEALRQRRRRERLEREREDGGRDSEPPEGGGPGGGGGRDGVRDGVRDSDAVSRPMSRPEGTLADRDQGRDAGRDPSPPEERTDEKNSILSSSSGPSGTSDVPTTTEGTDTAREAPPGPAAAVTLGVTAPVTPAALTEAEVFGALERDTGGRVGVLPPGLRPRLLARLAQLEVTREIFAVMVEEACAGRLLGQKDRPVTDLALLVGARDGEAVVLSSWANASKHVLKQRREAAARAEREATQRKRDLTPVPPGGTAAGARASPTAPGVVGTAPKKWTPEEIDAAKKRAAGGAR
jgi:hypothetical protein